MIKSFVLALTLVVASVSLATAQSVNTVQTTDDTKVTTTTVKVKGVGCAADLKSISANVERLKGVSTCKTLKKGSVSTFEVKYNPALVSKESIHFAIEDTPGCKNPNDRPYKVKQ